MERNVIAANVKRVHNTFDSTITKKIYEAANKRYQQTLNERVIFCSLDCRLIHILSRCLRSYLMSLLYCYSLFACHFHNLICSTRGVRAAATAIATHRNSVWLCPNRAYVTWLRLHFIDLFVVFFLLFPGSCIFGCAASYDDNDGDTNNMWTDKTNSKIPIFVLPNEWMQTVNQLTLVFSNFLSFLHSLSFAVRHMDTTMDRLEHLPHMFLFKCGNFE